MGVIFGLSPDDIDVRRALSTYGDRSSSPRATSPTSLCRRAARSRSVPLPASVHDAILAHLADHPAKEVILPWDMPDGDPATVSLLLTSRESKPVNRHYFNAKIWKPALIAAGVPPTRENGCHALRHYIRQRPVRRRRVDQDGERASRTFRPRVHLAYVHPSSADQREPHQEHHRHRASCSPRYRVPPPAQVAQMCHDHPDDVRHRSSVACVALYYDV